MSESYKKLTPKKEEAKKEAPEKEAPEKEAPKAEDPKLLFGEKAPAPKAETKASPKPKTASEVRRDFAEAAHV